jgi:uncharacterized cupredoxin-like copper-binding protein
MKVRAVLLVISSLAGLLAGCGAPPRIQIPPATSATIAVRYSRFDSGVVVVRAGVPINFTLKNDDPIEHEWIVGTAQVHDVHRTGTEAFHDSRPTEVTIPALTTLTTTVTFEQPGELQYICHLPGHEAYGMVGNLVVTEN